MSSPSISRPRRAMRRSHWLASTALAASLTPACFPPAAAQPVDLPTIVVSPTSIPTPIEQVASSVTVITAEQIEREQRRTVPDALSAVPGLNVIQTGGPGGLTAVSVRGTNANHVKVLIDGIPVSDPSNDDRLFDFGQLLTADIDRIEILRGPQSGLYGADAIGGVISIITKAGKGPPKFTTSVEGGSFGTFNQTASLSGSTDRFSYAFNAAHFRSTDTAVTPLNLLPPGRVRNNDFYDNATVSTKLGAVVTDNITLNFVGRYTDAKLRFTADDFDPVTFTAVPAAQQSISHVRQFFTRGEAVVSLLDGHFVNYFGVNYVDHWTWSKSPDTIFGPSPATVNSGDRIKYDWRGVVNVLPGHALVLGVEQDTERLRTATVRAENSNGAAYAEWQANFFERFFLVANVRHDENDSFGAATTYRVAPALLVPVTNTKIKGSVGTGFKAPTLSQLFVDFPAFGFFANPNLRPEESIGYDVGFEQPIWNDRVRFGATYFHNDITNLINTAFVPGPPPFTTLENVGRAETSGVETFVSLRVTDRLRLRADYTYTKAINAVTGLELLRRPHHKGSVSAYWDPTDALSVSATMVHVGSWIDGNRDFSIPRLTAPGYTLVNLAANYRVHEHLTLFGRIDNLFDVRYENPTGFERPGFGIFGGIRLANR